jgi:Flp pilus assembly pilin Flp
MVNAQTRRQKCKSTLQDDSGAATAEYAIATMAAVGFAGLLVVIMRSEEVKEILFDLVRSALTFSGADDSSAKK